METPERASELQASACARSAHADGDEPKGDLPRLLARRKKDRAPSLRSGAWARDRTNGRYSPMQGENDSWRAMAIIRN
jgi:hypothetical protein